MNEKNAINVITEADVMNFHHNRSMDNYQHIAGKSAIYPGSVGNTNMGLVYVTLKCCGEAGEFAEHLGKAMRDDSFMDTEEELTEARKEALIKEIGDELWYLARKCTHLGITLSDAAMENLQKLQSRSMRDKLRGSGDNR